MPKKRTFVSHYWLHSDHHLFLYLGIRTAKYAPSDIDTMVTGYENKLRELKTALAEGVAGQTGVVKHTRRSDVLGLWSDFHGPGIQ